MYTFYEEIQYYLTGIIKIITEITIKCRKKVKRTS